MMNIYWTNQQAARKQFIQCLVCSRKSQFCVSLDASTSAEKVLFRQMQQHPEGMLI